MVCWASLVKVLHVMTLCFLNLFRKGFVVLAFKKIPEEIIQQIKKEYKQGALSDRKLAFKYGISRTKLYSIVKHKKT